MKQCNRRLHFSRAMHSRHPYPPIGDAAHRQNTGGPSHGHRQHAQKFGKDRACDSGDILRGQRETERQTDRQTQTDILITKRANLQTSKLVNRSRKVCESSKRTVVWNATLFKMIDHIITVS